MLLNTLASYLACSVAVSSAMMIPPPLLRRHQALKADVTFFQNTIQDSTSCGSDAVSTDTILAGTCLPLQLSSLSITPLKTHNCKVTVYKGSIDCNADRSSTETTRLLAGAEPVCLNTGSLKSVSESASAMMHCGPEVSEQPSRVRRAVTRLESAPLRLLATGF